MFSRPFHPDRFLRSVYGTEPFADYCRQRSIPFGQTLSPEALAGDFRRWAAALAELPHEQHARVELELATVNEMAGRDALAHLTEVADAEALPPVNVPGGAPLALWFFLNQPALFEEVFLHHEIREVDSWRTAQAPPGIDVADLKAKTVALAASLRQFFRLRERKGPFCTVDAYRLSEAICFVAQVADRLQFHDVFSDSGQPATQRLRPALPVLIVYYPKDGAVLLKSHLRSRDRTTELFQHFGSVVLGCPIACDEDAFDLELFKRPFHPLPGAEDMELIRVKTLHLRYPERSGRRQLKLETRASDATDAIDHLLRSHIAPVSLARLRVCYAELQVRLRLAGGRKNYLIRLWPNRSSLGQTPLGERFRACLKHWGLSHAR